MYYKDGIIASYMGLQFGVTYREIEKRQLMTMISQKKVTDIRDAAELIGVEAASGWGDGSCWWEVKQPETFFIHPESHHIFQPQEGDKNINGFTFYADEQHWRDTGWSFYLDPHELPISERNGKAFIMAERGE